MNLVDKIFFDPITKSLKYFSRSGVDATKIYSNVYATGINQACGGSQIIPFSTKIQDTNNEYNGSTGIFTAKSPGRFLIICGLVVDSGTPSYDINIRKNSVGVIRAGMRTASKLETLNATINLNTNDTLDIFLVFISGPTSLTASTTIQFLNIQQLS